MDSMGKSERKGEMCHYANLTLTGRDDILKSYYLGKVGAEMQIVGHIDFEIFNCVTEYLTTSEVIITPERIQHIMERHPGSFEKIKPFLEQALSAPDYILADKNPNTGLVLKLIEEKGVRFQLVLRIHTPVDHPDFKNSVISAWEISESRWNNYIKNKTILYKRE